MRMRVDSTAMAVVLLVAAFAGGLAAAGESVVGPRPQSVDDRWILDPPGITVET